MTEILDDSAVSEIEAALLLHVDGKVMLRVDYARALVDTVKHLRELAYVPKILRDDDEVAYRDQAERLLREKVDLQSQLEQLRADIEKVRELVTVWRVQCDEMEPEVNRTWDDDGALRIRTIRKLADELSLTLDQVKPGEM